MAIGEDSNIINRIGNVDVLVIDAEYFSADEIKAIKENNVKEIYSYLNIGSVENFRSYYEEYESYTLGEYENWPEERWVDVSKPKWREFIAERVNELSLKGIDGFFIDNTDVFYLYPTDEIYEGIVDILSNIKETDKKVIINGGDCFVKTYIESANNETPIFDGVNQENVYTKYDFSNNGYIINDEEERQYYTEYLDMIMHNGYRAYALEYATDSKVADRAYEYSQSHNYICYVADNIELKLNAKCLK